MIMRARLVLRGVFIVLGVLGLTLTATNASAQGNLDKFVVKGEAAKKALSKTEISGDTAEKIAKVCLDFAAAHNIAVIIFILSPSGNIVHAHRMDGQSPVNIDTGLYKAQTALYMRSSTHAAANRLDMAGQVTRIKLGMYFVSGGLPIIVDDTLIGAIGVGGSNMDEECAYQALTSVLGPQPPLAPNQPRGANTPPLPAPPQR
jgi:glc operon protein GlcG